MALEIADLAREGGGAWGLRRPVNWKKSSIQTFQGRPALRVFYGKGSGTSSDPGVGGMAIVAVPKALDPQASAISFEVFFDKGWHFSKGGKIGGFFVGAGVASGYRHSDTGASHRVMWKADGGAISYIYPPGNLRQEDPKLKPEGHGIGYFGDLFPTGTLRVGEWNSVMLGVRMNSFTKGRPNPDGVALLTINGKTGIKKDIRWSRSPDLVISSLDINTFFGGPDPAVRDCTAYFRDFRLVPMPA